jgi:ATP-dependent DNA helicase RecG
VRQKGASDLKLASLRRDKDLVAQARQVAFDLIDTYPGLEDLPDMADEIRFLVDEDERSFLFKS